MVLTQLDLIAELNRLVRETGSQYAAARLLGVSKQMISQVLSGTRPPGRKIPAALGLRRMGSFYETNPP